MEIKRMDFFMVPRQLFADGAFKAEPFSKREALLDLIQMASIETKTVVAGGMQVQIERGQVFASVRFLAKKWGWSNDRTIRTLRALEAEHFIERNPNTLITTISICNFNLYSGDPNTTANTTANTPNGESRTNNKNKDKEQEGKEKDTNVSKEKGELIERLYKIYPTTCPISGRSLGKNSKNKKQLETLLKTRTPEDIELTIREYIVDCKNHNTYLKNFSTFLNQFPEKKEAPAPPPTPAPSEKRSPELMAIDAMHAGVRDVNIVRQGILMVWGESLSEDKLNAALYNAGYQV